jgi:hypothetical protein
MKSLKEIFPKGSESFFKANLSRSGFLDGTMPEPAKQNAATGRSGAGNGKSRGRMNRTEREFSFILEAMKRKGDILRWEYEGITLRWEVGEEIIKYTPDFVVFPPAVAVSGQVKFIEIKGRFTKGKFERAVERFRHAKTYWPEFVFELHQKTVGGWKRIL